VLCAPPNEHLSLILLSGIDAVDAMLSLSALSPQGSSRRMRLLTERYFCAQNHFINGGNILKMTGLQNHGYIETEIPDDGEFPARITAVYRERYELLCGHCRQHGKLRHEALYAKDRQEAMREKFARNKEIAVWSRRRKKESW